MARLKHALYTDIFAVLSSFLSFSPLFPLLFPPLFSFFPLPSLLPSLFFDRYEKVLIEMPFFF